MKLGAQPVPKQSCDGAWYKLPHDAGEFGIRYSDKHGQTIDVNIPGYDRHFKIHYEEKP